MAINNRIAAFHDDMTAWRRELHAMPETAFEEHRTAAFVASKLEEWGIEVHRGIATTGVVGVLRGRSDNGGAIGLRADMDALPMTEENDDLPHKSKVPGKMHACGHDGHTVMLLGAARHLAETRNFDGTVYFIFQPAEEGGGGGKVMIDEGLFERFPMETVWGMHNAPGLPAGTIGVRAGPSMAATDTFDVVVEGVGGHAARPQMSIDPIAVGTQLYQAFQTIVSRNTDPVESAVLSVTQFHAGEAYNVIPARAILRGTVRTYKPEIRDLIERRMGEACIGLAAAHGCRIDFEYHRGYPALVNSEAETALAEKVAAEVVGRENILHTPPLMGGEDFAYMLEAKPGSYIWVGQKGGPSPYMVHHPKYDFNDAILPIGASYWAKLVEMVLPRADAR
ncbi:MAG TPA: M20 aminoacylase family protein [Azospirillaceae bacterium]|nr:M20 aminoacylase family protein [Azospirillaceae bacterium]